MFGLLLLLMMKTWNLEQSLNSGWNIIANQNEGKAVSTNPNDYQKSAVVRQYGRESTSTEDKADKGVKVYYI